MTRVGLLLVAAALLPSLASAQRRGMGGAKDADWDAVAEKKAPAGPTIASKDFEGVSIYKIYIDKKKDLKLTEAQITALKEADAKLKESNAERFKLLDSLKKDARPKTSGTPSAEDEARMVIAREALNGVVRDIKVSYDEAAKAPVSGFDEAQTKTAQELFKKYEEEMQEMMRSKMGRGGMPPAGGGRRPGGN